MKKFFFILPIIILIVLLYFSYTKLDKYESYLSNDIDTHINNLGNNISTLHNVTNDIINSHQVTNKNVEELNSTINSIKINSAELEELAQSLYPKETGKSDYSLLYFSKYMDKGMNNHLNFETDQKFIIDANKLSNKLDKIINSYPTSNKIVNNDDWVKMLIKMQDTVKNFIKMK